MISEYSCFPVVASYKYLGCIVDPKSSLVMNSMKSHLHSYSKKFKVDNKKPKR